MVEYIVISYLSFGLIATLIGFLFASEAKDREDAIDALSVILVGVLAPISLPIVVLLLVVSIIYFIFKQSYRLISLLRSE